MPISSYTLTLVAADDARQVLALADTLCRVLSLEEVAVESGATVERITAGKIAGNDKLGLLEFFAKQGWHLYTPSWIAAKIRALAEKDYEDKVVTIVTKILSRNLEKSESEPGNQS